ncbi:hypothetical protein [Elioraea rosea]|uniref:hypothetical protein n=1 Tax=Elioraea rosea TaxID=2492390 RepID=UPI0013158F61|nr:hypothetical protein [Elioraea rosea]
MKDTKTGRFVTVKGVGALAGSGFKVRSGVDLTKPIAKQAFKDPAPRSTVGRGTPKRA